MPGSTENQSQLLRWIESATGDLTRRASKRLSDEFQDHYTEAVDDALESGATDDEAHAQAMSALGDSLSTHLAAIPVHGDPYRLKVKAGIGIVGACLVLFSLMYASTLIKRAERPVYDGYDLTMEIQKGNLEKVQEILGAGVIPTHSHVTSAIWCDLEDENNLQMLRLVLEAGLETDSDFGMEEGKASPLYTLIRNNNRRGPKSDSYRASVFDLLAEYGVNITSGGTRQPWSTMEFASYYKDEVIIRKLQEAGVPESIEALIYQGRFEEVMEWIEREPSVLKKRYTSGATIGHILASVGRSKELGQVIQLGVDINTLDKFDRSILYHAFSNSMGKRESCSVELVNFLLDMGSDPNISDRIGSTPLHWAASGFSLDLVESLLKHGADPNAQINNGWSTLHIAMVPTRSDEIEDEEEIAIALIEAGADIHAKDEFGNTPLHYAVATNMHRVIRELVRRGASLEARNSEYNGRRNSIFANIGEGDMYTPLHVATVGWSDEPIDETIETISILLDLGADINARGGYGRTPIWNASNSLDIEVVRFLLERGADPTIPDEGGISALHTRNPKKTALFAEFGYETFSEAKVASQ